MQGMRLSPLLSVQARQPLAVVDRRESLVPHISMLPDDGTDRAPCITVLVRVQLDDSATAFHEIA